MSAYELQRRKIWVKEEFSKMTNIMRRLPANLAHPLLYLAMNLSINGKVKKDYKKLEWQTQEIYIPANSMPPEGTVLKY
jgi:hypothetical protein